MTEGVAEAVVAVFQHATATFDISQLATRADVAGMVTKDEIADLHREAAGIRAEILQLEVRLSERLRMQGRAILGGPTMVMGVFTLIGRIIA